MIGRLKNLFNRNSVQTDDDIIRKKRIYAFLIAIAVIVGILAYSYWGFVRKQAKLRRGKER